jgi:alpha-D-ribose 1-methylphosphonate 5-triphosphate diphosphatase PhnM
MKLSAKHKAAIKSYARAVVASGITVVLAIAGDMRPEYAILLGSVLAPIIKAIDPTEKQYGLVSKE